VIKKFDHELLEKAKGLSKRKDGVFAVELSFSVGDQTEWREFPTQDKPEGASKAGNSKRINQLIKATRTAVEAELGSERIISMVLHTDESTPHIHVVFAPILDGKLNAKHWTGGAAKCAAFRKKIHGHFNKIFPCTYTEGAPGGEPHDQSKAAGGPNGPQPAGGLLQRAGEMISASKEVKTLRDAVTKLQTQLQAAFSRQKRAELKAIEAKKDAEEANRRAAIAERETRKVQKDRGELKELITALEARIEALKPKPAPRLPEALKRAPTPR
jgi:hypothetical protein